MTFKKVMISSRLLSGISLRDVFCTWMVLFSVVLCCRGKPECTPGIPLFKFHNFSAFESGLEQPKITSDQYGRILTAAGGQIYRYEGVEWKALLSDQQFHSEPIVSICFDQNHRLYAGGYGNWGYLQATNQGAFEYVSLRERQIKNDSGFEGIMATSHGVGFLAPFSYIWVYPDGQTLVFENLYQIYTQFELRDEVYIAAEREGLMVIRGDKLESLTHINAFGNHAITSSSRFSENEIILGTEQAGLFIFDGQETKPFLTDCPLMTKKRVSDVALIEDRFIAVSLESWGLVILDRNGRMVNSISKLTDTRFRNISQLFYAGNGNLWVSVSRGIVQIFFPSPITAVDDRHGLEVVWPRVRCLGDDLYIKTNRHLFIGIPDEQGTIQTFERFLLPSPPVRSSSTYPEIRTWDGIVESTKVEYIEPIGTEYALALSGESWIIHADKTASPLIFGVNLMSIFSFDDDPDSLVGTNNDGLYLFSKEQGEWVYHGEYLPAPGSNNEFYKRDRWGNYWIERGRGRVMRFKIVDGKLEGRIYTTADGLLEDWTRIYSLGDDVYFFTTSLVKTYDPETDELVDVPEQRELFNLGGQNPRRPAELDNGNIIVPYNDRILLFEKQEDGSYMTNLSTFSCINEGNLEVYPDDCGDIWLRSQNLLLRYDPSMPSFETKPVKNVIDKIVIAGKNQVVYTSNALAETVEPSSVQFDYDPNGISIYFSSPYYSTPLPLKHQYRLEGFTKEWSEPSFQTRADFIALREGNYTFHLRTIDFLGRVGDTVSFSFKITPPFYRSAYAYTMYCAVIFLILLMSYRWVQYSSERERRRLEAEVQERTGELHKTAEKLRKAAFQAESANRAKSQFLANMSHEIRTPIHGVIGTIELMKGTRLDREQSDLLGIVNTSANSLLSIINDILDYSKIEANRIDFEYIPFRLELIVQETVDILTEISYRKQVELFYEIEDSVPEQICGDPYRLRQILVNLVGNALKFTNKGYVNIHFRAKRNPDNDSIVLMGEVQDTGIGISEKSIKSLFRSFSQVDYSNTRHYGGTGLGLAICKGLLDLMGGTISVESEIEKGSIFRFDLQATVVEGVLAEKKRMFDQQSVLVFDRYPIRSGIIERALQRVSLNPVCCNSLESFLDYLNSDTGWDYVLIEESPSLLFRDVLRNTLEKAASQQIGNYGILAYPESELPDVPRSNVLLKPLKIAFLMDRIRDGLSEVPVTKKHQITSHDIAGLYPLSILLVEDNLVNQRVGIKILEKLGYHADQAWDGNEALQMVEKIHYDLILMDVQMPELDGLEATRLIKNRQDRPPQIIGLTAGAMQADRLAALEAGMDDFLTKPFTIKEMERAVVAAYRRLRS